MYSRRRRIRRRPAAIIKYYPPRDPVDRVACP